MHSLVIVSGLAESRMYGVPIKMAAVFTRASQLDISSNL